MFYTKYVTYFSFRMLFKMSSAICFNLDQSKILSSDKGLNLSTQVLVLHVCSTKRLKTLGEKEKSLVTSNFSFFPTGFSTLLKKFSSFLSNLKFVGWKRVLKTLGKEEIARNEQFLLFPHRVFYPFGEVFIILNKFKICRLEKGSENTVEKEEIARNEQFLLVPHGFLPFWRCFWHFHHIQKLSSANSLCLGKPKICHFRKG